jgi:hypothetical protein
MPHWIDLTRADIQRQRSIQEADGPVLKTRQFCSNFGVRGRGDDPEVAPAALFLR